ncbi:MAG: hypothetical protein GC182_08510 [Rhodopseudomonas sp.]|nr:hypothetical protein [Rhodopseudomonas sp.]
MFQHYPEGRDGLIGSIRRATVSLIDDSGDQQLLARVSGHAGEQFSKVPRLQSHGFAANPPSGSSGLFLALGGRSDRLYGLGFEHQDFRQRNLPEGAAVLYDHKGNCIFAKTDNGIQIHAKLGKIYVRPADGEFVYLGGTGDDGHVYSPVVTLAGPSTNVKARVD